MCLGPKHPGLKCIKSSGRNSFSCGLVHLPKPSTGTLSPRDSEFEVPFGWGESFCPHSVCSDVFGKFWWFTGISVFSVLGLTTSTRWESGDPFSCYVYSGYVPRRVVVVTFRLSLKGDPWVWVHSGSAILVRRGPGCGMFNRYSTDDKTKILFF